MSDMRILRLEDTRKTSMGAVKGKKAEYNANLKQMLANETAKEREERNYNKDLIFLINAVKTIPKDRRKKLQDVLNMLDELEVA